MDKHSSLFFRKVLDAKKSCVRLTPASQNWDSKSQEMSPLKAEIIKETSWVEFLMLVASQRHVTIISKINKQIYKYLVVDDPIENSS